MNINLFSFLSGNYWEGEISSYCASIPLSIKIVPFPFLAILDSSLSLYNKKNTNLFFFQQVTDRNKKINTILFFLYLDLFSSFDAVKIGNKKRPKSYKWNCTKNILASGFAEGGFCGKIFHDDSIKKKNFSVY